MGCSGPEKRWVEGLGFRGLGFRVYKDSYFGSTPPTFIPPLEPFDSLVGLKVWGLRLLRHGVCTIGASSGLKNYQ